MQPIKAFRLGLRGKLVLALVVACVLVLVPALVAGGLLFNEARQHFGQAYARNFTQLSRDRIREPVQRDLALSRLLAKSPALHAMLRDPDARNRSAFFKIATNYLATFDSNAYFVANGLNKQGYYFNQEGRPLNDNALYHLNPDDPKDGWFYSTLHGTQPYNINVNYDTAVKQTRVWINVVIRDKGQAIGLVGAGLDLSRFLNGFINHAENGVIPLIVNDQGAIQAYPDKARIALNTAGQSVSHSQTLSGLLTSTPPDLLATLLEKSRAQPDSIVLHTVQLDGESRLLAISYIPELHWHVATLVDLRAANIVGARWLMYLGFVALAVLLMLLLGFGYSVEQLMVRPLRALRGSAQSIARGDYAARLPSSARTDEIGALGHAFAAMADQVQAHTTELENKVRDRTAALQASHERIAQANRQIGDSINYASLIQRAVLPDRELEHVLGNQHYVLWKPRDVVGGDFYLFKADGDNFLIGIMDCAGHGVPGALMTMLARSAVDHALTMHGLHDPAQLLQQTDVTLRHLLADADLARTLATTVDAGLIYVDQENNELVFAGAAIRLFHSDGDTVETVQGTRRPLGDRRPHGYHNSRLPLRQQTTYCLVTDGLLDQAGGAHGFGFGSDRLKALLQTHAHQALHEQAVALEDALAEYQNGYPQRDDITILSFRLD